MIDQEHVDHILERAREAFDELDEAKARLYTAQARVNILCREYSLATGTYAFKDYMLRKELRALRNWKRA